MMINVLVQKASYNMEVYVLNVKNRFLATDGIFIFICVCCYFSKKC